MRQRRLARDASRPPPISACVKGPDPRQAAKRRSQARLAAASAPAHAAPGRAQSRRRRRAVRRDPPHEDERLTTPSARRLDHPDRRHRRTPPRPTPFLTRARERNRSTLASAKPVTEKVRKGDATLYRARFAGLDAASAEAACRSLKRSGFSCFARPTTDADRSVAERV